MNLEKLKELVLTLDDRDFIKLYVFMKRLHNAREQEMEIKKIEIKKEIFTLNDIPAFDNIAFNIKRKKL